MLKITDVSQSQRADLIRMSLVLKTNSAETESRDLLKAVKLLQRYELKNMSVKISQGEQCESSAYCLCLDVTLCDRMMLPLCLGCQ